MNPDQKQFLQQAGIAAAKAGHIFALMAACEAALESEYGKSLLAAGYNNLFGCKQHRHAIYQTHNLPTREFENGAWAVVNAAWIVYPDWDSCFADRMATLNRLSPYLPHYRAALDAQDPRSYVIQVSQSWSTDPGWKCSCCAMFEMEPDAQEHAKQYPSDTEHAIERIPGLGRALKVLTIYDRMRGQWDPADQLGDVQIAT